MGTSTPVSRAEFNRFTAAVRSDIEEIKASIRALNMAVKDKNNSNRSLITPESRHEIAVIVQDNIVKKLAPVMSHISSALKEVDYRLGPDADSLVSRYREDVAYDKEFDYNLLTDGSTFGSPMCKRNKRFGGRQLGESVGLVFDNS